MRGDKKGGGLKGESTHFAASRDKSCNRRWLKERTSAGGGLTAKGRLAAGTTPVSAREVGNGGRPGVLPSANGPLIRTNWRMDS